MSFVAEVPSDLAARFSAMNESSPSAAPVIHRTETELEAELVAIRAAPSREGTLALIVRRPAVDLREELPEAQLDPAEGVVGDSWKLRSSSRMKNGGPHPEMQLNIMNARAIAALSPDRARWSLAGDQLYIDLDVSEENLPPGTRLAIGEGGALVEVTAEPHTGCAKFSHRFGPAALRFVNSPAGRKLRLRGFNAKVVAAGVIRAGDAVRKIERSV